RPPYYEVSPTHKARTWLLDPRAPHVEPPEIISHIRNIKLDKMGDGGVSASEVSASIADGGEE
ncbi:MAG: hypothetical protein GX975_01435, partial [Clostridiales bacterium]|nr:hypothetical protein [Clostridiales bacterium]